MIKYGIFYDLCKHGEVREEGEGRRERRREEERGREGEERGGELNWNISLRHVTLKN